MKYEVCFIIIFYFIIQQLLLYSFFYFYFLKAVAFVGTKRKKSETQANKTETVVVLMKILDKYIDDVYDGKISEDHIWWVNSSDIGELESDEMAMWKLCSEETENRASSSADKPFVSSLKPDEMAFWHCGTHSYVIVHIFMD